MRYCGREFTDAEIDLIRRLIATTPRINRAKLSRIFCEQVGWLKPDGGLKDMSCRVAMLRMHRDGHICLPHPQKPANNDLKKGRRTLLAEPQPEILQPAGEHALEIDLANKGDSALWNEYMDRYHYLGYFPLPGAQLRYFVRSGGQTLALLGFGAAAWKTEPRDSHIGWDAETRKRNLHLIINNARFLMLPWVRSKNLASRILSLVGRRIAYDWKKRYNYEPVLLETFVEKERFQGTCYKAANWIYTGDTKGRGKLDVRHAHNQPVKSVWLYPLRKDFRKLLTRNEG
ncbi:MAG: DUF4338 domain-containing protein [Nitrospiraceae bacterium]|nr:DUF4338 domain-containing protein [Nitrospiraceae bacterium]